MEILIIEEETLAYKSLLQIVQSLYPLAKVTHSRGFPIEMVEGIPAPDLTIVDIAASEKMRISNIKKLRSHFHDKAILIVSAVDEQVFAVPFIKAGADGFISRKAPEEEFRRALRTIVSGRKYLSKPVWEVVVQDAIEGKGQVGSPAIILSAREKMVLSLMIEGNSAREMAGLLKVKEVTISKYKNHLRKKLNAKNTKDLIKRAAIFL